MDLDTLWQSTLGEMEIQLSKANFSTWLKTSRLIEKKEGTFVVALPNNFAKTWVEEKYQKNILGILRVRDDSVKKVEFVVGGDKAAVPAQKPAHSQVKNPKIDSMELDLKNTKTYHDHCESDTNLN